MLDKDQWFGFVVGLMERKGTQSSDPTVRHEPVDPASPKETATP